VLIFVCTTTEVDCRQWKIYLIIEASGNNDKLRILAYININVLKIEIHLWSTCLTNYCQDSHGLFQNVTVIRRKKNVTIVNHYLSFNFKWRTFQILKNRKKQTIKVEFGMK
jgi:hypothetical protein